MSTAADGSEQQPCLGLLHTTALHEPRFARLHAEHCADLPLIQSSEPSLLALAREHGAEAASVADAVTAACRRLVDAGATSLLCTCSTIGALAEAASAELCLPVLRVDRAMAAEAVSLAGQGNGRIAMLVTLESTLTPSRELIEEEAARAEVRVQLQSILVEGAFEAAMAGEAERANELITNTLRDLVRDGGADLAVLAQVSMADAQPAGGQLDTLPVLSSPVYGLCTAVEICRAR